jgi:hypothetical protein
MELHGSDLVFENVKVPISEDLVIPIIKTHWPELVYEAMMENGDLHLFMHPNQHAEESWDDEGWSEENDITLIYMIWDESKAELTFVIDDEKKNKYIVDDIQKGLGF